MTHAELREKVKLLPEAPGVYMMKNKSGKIIYVGKSKNLHNRVSHYFQAPSMLDAKTAKLSMNIDDFECIYTASESEALILENELIKRHTPKYNIKLKDSKTYPYIKLDYEKPFPKISISRTRRDDKAAYFGPYTSARAANEIIDTISKSFKIATCKRDFEYGKKLCRHCLFYHLGQCIGPCSGNISQSEYRSIFFDIEAFLKGDYKASLDELEKKMIAYADKLDFENAAKCRDKINSIKRLQEHQGIVTNPDKEFDVFGLYIGETSSAMSIVFIRNGKVIDKEDYIFSSDELCENYEISDFIERFYKNCEYIPKNILLSFSMTDDEIQNLKEKLSSNKKSEVRILIPERGEKKAYTIMARRNASEAVRQKLETLKKSDEALIKLASLLKLEVVPERIEAYDISNNGVSDMFGGMIVIENGSFKKSDYRVFSVKELDNKVDDYAAMSEVLRRRLSYLFDNNKSNQSFSIRPDLILLDGGMTHVNTILKLCSEMGLDIPIIGMIKDDFHKTRTLTDGEREVSIANDLSLFTFIYGIQEEVHRFTFSKMDASRTKKVKTSKLLNIEGVGDARAKLLMKRFKSIQNIKNATVDEICSCGISKTVAENILKYLNQ